MSTSFWSRFRSEHIIELRALRQGGAVRRWWLRPAGLDFIATELNQLNSQGYGIYAGVNPRSACGRSDGGAVAEVIAFHVDVDGRLPTSWPVTVPKPTLLVNSGHGFHVYWWLKKSITVSDSNCGILKGINRSLAVALGGDVSCHDLARILRVPGFTNYKPPVAEVCVVKSELDRKYQLSPFDSLPAVILGNDKRSPIVPVKAIHRALLNRKLQKCFEEVRRRDPVLRHAWRGEYGDGSSDSRFVAVRQLLASGRFKPPEVVALVVSRRWYNRRSGRVRSPEKVYSDVVRLVAKLRRSRVRSTGPG